jgi:hypothetical protein
MGHDHFLTNIVQFVCVSRMLQAYYSELLAAWLNHIILFTSDASRVSRSVVSPYILSNHNVRLLPVTATYNNSIIMGPLFCWKILNFSVEVSPHALGIYHVMASAFDLDKKYAKENVTILVNERQLNPDRHLACVLNK